MNHEEALKQLAAECPRKIMGLLHAKGLYVHGSSARFPGKVGLVHGRLKLESNLNSTPVLQRGTAGSPVYPG